MATGQSKTKWNSDLLAKNGSRNSEIALTYASKLSESDILSQPPGEYACLYEGSDTSNRLYFDDNLPVLAALLNDESVRGQVRLIYIDPPYATGGVFKSRTEKDAYTDLMGGAEYIEFLRQRLVFLRELLADDGSIYVHLDANMAFQIKIIMDEVFGESNFRNWITRKKCNPKNYTRKTYGNISDFILFYTKSDDYVWHRPYNPWTEESANKEYQYVEEETGRRYKKVPIHAPGTRNGATGQPWRGMMPPPGKHWQYTPEKLEEMDARGEIYWSPTGNPRRKIYLDQSPGKPAQDIWLDFKDAHNQNIKITGYPTEKNPDLLRRIVRASSNPGDLVLDCFSGSGTTLDVAAELNRRWLGVDNSLAAIDAILKRFVIGRHAMGDFVNDPAKTKKDDVLPQRTLFDYLVDQPDQEKPIGQNEHVAKQDAEYGPVDNIKFSIFGPEQEREPIQRLLSKWYGKAQREGVNV
jgi:adenine-specific DNA-methyltransferase